MRKVRGSLSWIVHAVGMGAVAVGGTARVTTEVAAVGVKVEEQGLDVSGEQK